MVPGFPVGILQADSGADPVVVAANLAELAVLIATAAAAVDIQPLTNDYDANGNVLRTTAANPLGSGDQVTEFVHDETNRVVEQRVLLAAGDPLRTRLFYDRSDRVVMTVDAAGWVTQSQYNAQDKPEVQIAHLNGEPLPFGDAGNRRWTRGGGQRRTLARSMLGNGRRTQVATATLRRSTCALLCLRA